MICSSVNLLLRIVCLRCDRLSIQVRDHLGLRSVAQAIHDLADVTEGTIRISSGAKRQKRVFAFSVISGSAMSGTGKNRSPPVYITQTYSGNAFVRPTEARAGRFGDYLVPTYH